MPETTAGYHQVRPLTRGTIILGNHGGANCAHLDPMTITGTGNSRCPPKAAPRGGGGADKPVFKIDSHGRSDGGDPCRPRCRGP